MLDVHPPEHAAHTWRDFFIHIGTIAIGLLIALALEAGVEVLHHRHIVRESRENIRREMETNLAELTDDTRYIQADHANMEQNLERLRLLRSNPHALDHGTMHFTFSWQDMKSSAWHSARDTGALPYMPTEEVEDDADVYSDQEIVNKQATELFTQQTLATLPLRVETETSTIPPEGVTQLLSGCAETLIRLELLQQMVDGLKKNYTETLKRHR
jgi:hypothetical protein